MPVISTSMLAGVPGHISRPQVSVIETGVIDPDKAPQAFGVPVKIVGGKIQLWEAADTSAEKFYGVLGLTSPGTPGSMLDADNKFETGVPNVKQTQNLLVQGYANVICAIGTPARGGDVYVRYKVVSGKKIGDFEATSASGENVKLTGVEWAVDGVDSAKVTELRII